MYRIGHRGASAYEPENTLIAFDKAIELGADMVELDIRLSKDGVLMVSHDSDISKYTDGQGYIENMTAKEIQEYRIEKNQKIPTLKEVFNHLNGRCGLYIEIKGEYLEDKLVYLIKEVGFNGPLIVGCFDAKKIEKVKQLDPLIETSLMVGTPYDNFIDKTLQIKANYVHFCWERFEDPHTLIKKEFMDEIHEKGLEVIIWHEERPEVIKEVEKFDIYGICGNKPELL
ncbi:glycerophosphoryl diester phosphodiesterase [Halanaerobium saccharolyticum]|uniref:Glycerophosphoryl diester phosphodiesterase n=1 Tax=Halanaerobium saccharolyticum TaxID=43595 RepID=A0A2T5RF37_9FIRM|nr:glycerophosphodiester phosphodiesterase family protein [Halanaerobium saccharolyticum]PTV92446.1 glycerophosphoryl diester phosphodiesterase [Halanaerobium saccharolyticum]